MNVGSTDLVNRCSGRGIVEIEVCCWGNPDLVCNGATCFSYGSDCASVPVSVQNAFATEAINRFNGMAGYQYTGNTYGLIPFGSGWQPPADLNGCTFGYWLQSTPNITKECTGQYVGTGYQYLFLNSNQITSAPPCNTLGWSNNNLVNWLWTTQVQPSLMIVNADFHANPFKMSATVGGTTCEYWLYGIDYTKTPDFSTCFDAHYGFDWIIDRVYWNSFSKIFLACGVRCGPDPCPVKNYNWPLTLSCGCKDYFKLPSVTGETSCNLYLTSTGPVFYSDHKCYYRATYSGAISAGIVDCNATPENLDCKCCGDS